MNSHDYSSGGTYFITICTHMGLSYFGNITNGKMILSESGQIAYNLWYEIPEHFSFVSLDEFVVMPNHVHGIVIIQSPTAVGTLHATSLLFQSRPTPFLYFHESN
jgi:REP element-mobilizing transposase RayT